MAPEPYVDPSDDRYVVYPTEGKRLLRVQGGDDTEPPESSGQGTEPPAGDRQEPTGDNTPDGGQAEPFTERFDPSALPEDLQPAYRQMQGHFTRRMQELSNLERDAGRLEELEDYFEQLQDPEGQEEILRRMGIELDDDDEFDDENDDPIEQMQSQIEALRAELDGRSEQEQQQELVQQEHAYIASEIDQIAAQAGEEFSEDEDTAIGALSQMMRDERGVPNVRGAYEMLFDKIVSERRKKWAEGKPRGASRPGSGAIPRDKLDIRDPEQRQQLLAQRLEEADAGVT